MKGLEKKLPAVFLATAMLAGNASAVFAVRSDLGDTEKIVYKVTFDDDSDEYTLMDGASLADGLDGKAVSLDNSEKQYVKLGDNITSEMTGDYTISVDFYPETEDSWTRIFDIASGTDNTMFFTNNGGGIPKFRFKGDDLFSNGVNFKLKEWNNVLITRKGGEAVLYINGEIAATANTFNNDLAAIGNTDKNYLGKSQYEADAFFNGMIDNFVIYNYALSEAEVKLSLSGDVQVTAGYKSDSGSELLAVPENGTVTPYASIKNYKNSTLNCTIITSVYNDSESNSLVGVYTDECILKPGEETVLENKEIVADKENKPERIVTYIYSDNGLDRVSALYSVKNVPSLSPAPEDTDKSTIGVHDPSIFKDPKSGVYYVYSTGMIDIFKSEDLINWSRTENTLPKLPDCVFDNYEHENESEYSNIWAPDMFYDEEDKETPYHLTCSYSDAFGKNNSSLILFKSSSPEGPWENGEIIFTSDSSDDELKKVNAIDSNICTDVKTGDKYMAYGSFWQGIHIKKLNDDYTVDDKSTVGQRIMSRYKGIGGPEGPWIIYNPDTEYYYMFTSYDDLNSTYNIRVARSKEITGPYADQNGNSVDRFEDDDTEAGNTYGYKLAGSYQFPKETTYYGPGHNSVLNEDGKWYLVHHVRTNKGGYARLCVRTMLWNEDGWPVVSPERYDGEDGSRTFDEKLLIGDWDYISIGDNTNDMMTSDKLILSEDHTLEYKNMSGTWSLENGNILNMEIGDEKISAYVLEAYDRDKDRNNIVFTGTNQDNTAKWGKKAVSSVIYN